MSKRKQMDIDEFLNKDEVIDDHGEVRRIAKEVLNVVKVVETRRADGSLRIQQDFSNCPTLAEQHTAHLTDINYLMEKFKPDELAAFMAARNQYRQEILGHDFSKELSLAEASDVVYRSRKQFEALPEEITKQFKNHLEFLKFIDNPANAEKMLQLGLIKKREMKELQAPLDQPERPVEPEPGDKAKK